MCETGFGGIDLWFGGPGGDLLSRALRHSTMGAGVFHGRVRDGIGCGHPAKATRSSKPEIFLGFGCVGFGAGPDLISGLMCAVDMRRRLSTQSDDCGIIFLGDVPRTLSRSGD